MSHKEGLPLSASFNEIAEYHNWKEFFKKKYKDAAVVPINFNKYSPDLSYILIKAYRKVNEISRPNLVQMRIPNYICSVSNEKLAIKIFLSEVIYNQIKTNSKTLVKDYIDMCIMCKEKINIRFRSKKKLQEAHDKISQKYYAKHTPLVKIPKNSKFKELRKILPSEFEYIKTRKRLIEETAIQHHCVWSYADKINRDNCAIYSYVDPTTKKTLYNRIRCSFHE